MIRADDLSELAPRINAEHVGGEDAARTGLERARRAGELLLKAKATCGRGKWLTWLRENVRMSNGRAHSYMRIAAYWAKIPDSGNLTIDAALRLLAGPTDPTPQQGEELRGAKQNRILNTSILVPAKAKIKVPVSCVEQGRWRYAGKHFTSSKVRSPHSLHYKLKASVSRSVQERGTHRSDQAGVWQEVAKKQEAFACASPTSAMADTYESRADKMTEYREQLKYPAGAAGVAVALGGKVVSLDLFDKATTCEKAWDRLLSGLVLDALEAKVEGKAEPQTVEQLVQESVGAT